MLEIITVPLVSFLGGVLPAAFWVWFWNKEDRLHPEPRKFIVLTFLAGMFTVALVIPLELLAENVITKRYYVLLAWVIIEEMLKFIVAYLLVLKRKAIADEPIDMIIYMMTIAFGFAAAENALFLLSSMQNSGILYGLITGNFRFLGATLLHALSSSIIGVSLALTFYSSKFKKILYTLVGIIIAIIVHFLFNIALVGNLFSNSLIIFSFVWIGIIFIIIAFEKAKRISKY